MINKKVNQLESKSLRNNLFCQSNPYYTPQVKELLIFSFLMVAFYFFRFSSEDSEETSSYLYDSDESEDMAKMPLPPAEMDLLGEILDSLSTHSSDQEKLSGAKSLDFFRSMEDIDYKTAVSFPSLWPQEWNNLLARTW